MSEQFTIQDYLWFFFPLLGWGFGLTMHDVFGVRLLGREIKQRQALVERRARRAR